MSRLRVYILLRRGQALSRAILFHGTRHYVRILVFPVASDFMSDVLFVGDKPCPVQYYFMGPDAFVEKRLR